ncbi:MAG: oxidoreductase [Sphingobacteriales bacterium 17-39-43]|uniref:Rossmann-like and DUF2520 domain-containing protein n=1 Tax=Daejeonella sp. TaxID=2805397 RepID=UPI000BD8AD7D|nr:Rossmann-like and DUF2520 domain-containing protein [Daejeonella sp.]OYZ30401.1 MAG: oxidoreductase [Sphingobacteriales bacterium 16-39-50]OZA23029.1 MAG: oxidoreductase [Sphingobacteriales bacterium 17-39-43]OZA60787.1 MAG: oxidoreductase [Sphingobacteriales bacterium 39-40-5]HQS51317.1 DUF2520 domain-containing protein [Daejeonella sp.]HQT24142.1 DUF2520 domain-containing protein [Daejeonella sp.]
MNIVILGSGNIATHLGRAFKMAGQDISQVWSRDITHASSLADTLAAEAIDNMFDLDRSADLFIIAVKDEAIREIALELKLSDQLLVHTSGSTGLSALEGASTKIGVFYPLQTFSKAKSVDFRQIPIIIEANSPEVLSGIRAIADRLSEKAIELNSEQRKILHVAAVFACNFTNHLFGLAQELLEEKGLDYELLKPLIEETLSKIELNDPVSVQTGPAIRDDQATIQSHLELLKHNPALSELYTKLSQSIVNLHKRSQG